MHINYNYCYNMLSKLSITALAFSMEPNEVVPARTIPCEHTHNLMEVAMIVRNRKGKRKHRK